MFPPRASLASKASPEKLAYRDQRYWLQVRDDVWERGGPGRVLEERLWGVRRWKGFLLYLGLHFPYSVRSV